MTNGIVGLKEYLCSHEICGNTVNFKEAEMLSLHSSFKIGGCADLYALPRNAEELVFLISSARSFSVRYFILGHGSNLLFDDAGFRGIVISTEAMNSVVIEGNEMTADCGAMLTSCAVMAKEASLSGMECLYGIPGSIGGAVYMNAGAYGGEMRDIVVSTTYLDPESLEVRTIVGDEHSFGYRESIFRENDGIILSTKMVLKTEDKDEISQRMTEYKRLRIEKQPLEYPSAGSTFKRYPGRYTAQMIDEAGLKGFSVGGAQVSEKHAGFVINKGNATSKDVCELIEHIKREIKKLHGIDIETEVIMVK